MALTDFTSFEEVRSALGVSVDEIEDAEIGLPLYENGLKVEMKLVSSTLISAYTTAMATPVGQRTEEEDDLVTATRLFATYSVARQLTTSLPLFSPKEIGDSKAMQVRYSTDPYRVVMAKIQEQFDKYRSYLEKALAAYTVTTAPAASVLNYFAVAPSGTTDPVTG